MQVSVIHQTGEYDMAGSAGGHWHLCRALNAGRARWTLSSLMAPGKQALMPACSCQGDMRRLLGSRKETHCPRACTPESVRPAACSRSSCPQHGAPSPSELKEEVQMSK